jgi:GntR family transcriptional repressor for pyruvate dehydrogenase complex
VKRNLVSPVKKTRLFEMVASRLADLILSGELKPGAKLPSEHDLADQFDVSRNVVREGLRSLAQQGLVAVRSGDGVYVQAPDQSTVIEALSSYLQLNRARDWVEELYEVRRMLEAEIVVLAARRATPEDVQDLEAGVERMRAHKSDQQEWARADWDFHRALARASHNSLLSVLSSGLCKQALMAFEEGWRHPKAYESGLRFHAEIIKYVRAHDSEGARETMLAHLEESYRQVNEVSRQRSPQETGG